MEYDFNVLEDVARDLMDKGNYRDAVAVYYFMSDGDPSLDGGYLGHKIGLCYEKMGDLQAARYWYGRAFEENPGIDRYEHAKKRLSGITIDNLIKLFIENK